MPPVDNAGLFQTPLVIQPGTQALQYDVTFNPSEEKNYFDSIVFISDAHSGIKTTYLTGKGIKGVYVPENNNTGIDFVIDVFPDPVSNLALIKIMQDAQRQYKLRIINSNGECLEEFPGIFSLENEEMVFHTGSLPNGVYFIQLIYSEGLITKKFVIAK
jgi:hypothetical protein